MARISDQQILEVVGSAITANNGSATHEQIVSALNSANMGSEATRLVDLVQNAQLTAEVLAQAEGSPVLVYKV